MVLTAAFGFMNMKPNREHQHNSLLDRSASRFDFMQVKPHDEAKRIQRQATVLT